MSREVSWWLDNRPPGRLLIALTAGTISWTGEDFDWAVTDSLSPELAGRFRREPLWADLRPYAGRTGPSQLGDIVADLAAPVLGVDKDTLVGEHVRQRRRTTRLLVSVVAALCVLLLSAVIAFVDARRQTEPAERQTAIATSRQLRALSEAALPSDPRTAIGLGLAAHRLYPAPESKHAVFRALAGTRYISTLGGHRERITEVAFASPGRLLATAGADGLVNVWDLTDPVRHKRVAGPVDVGIGRIEMLAFRPGSTLLAIGAWNDHEEQLSTPIVLWDVSRPFAGAHRVYRQPGSMTALTFLPGGNLMATSTTDGNSPSGQVHLWEVNSWSEARDLSFRDSGQAGAVTSLAATPDGRLLIAGTGEGDGDDISGTVTGWQVRDGTRLRRRGTVRLGPVAALAVAPDGCTVVAGGQQRNSDGVLTLLDISNRDRIKRAAAPA
ncbi:hypothetical protein OWR29_16750 [Actinoplanes sp. Pm04-4]|uniref:WD-40 repeat protein n=1 Tax=Paractinoplanes pyxinae TaxID=2997416 RepID=A0ABT4AZH6_9ACTN|nr:hypothetical protein [Actinoplanes pyxinae]MCY1139651.1 hypothetical protein [Actinoplanes pyxinae]